MKVTGLNADTTYYLVVQTRTDPHGYNQNTVYSEYSKEVPATTLDAVEVTMDLPGGWSMISLPALPEVATVSTLFPHAVIVYKYQKGRGYVRVPAGENLEIGMGYWIKLVDPQTYVIRGRAIREYTIPLIDQWYMIGGCSHPAQKMVTDGSIHVIYYYTQGVGYERLSKSEPLEPGKGYWIKFSNTAEGAMFTASTSVLQ